MEGVSVPSFYQAYVDRIQGGTVVQNLIVSGDQWVETLKKIPEASADHRYAPDKWTIKQVAQHLIDVERVFAYRTMRFARNDQTDLPGFDQDAYARQAPDRTLLSLIQEFLNVRSASGDLFASFNARELHRSGQANGHEMTVEAIGYVMAGHVWHHLAVLNERYAF